MWRRYVVRFISAVVAACLLAGCMTLTHGWNESGGITSSPPGATVTITPGNIVVHTPSQIALRRRDAYSVLIEKPGYEPATALISSHFDHLFWLNFLWVYAAPIAFGTDLVTGSAYRLEPTDVSVTMTPVTSPAPGMSSR
jgi:PEGA domain